MKKNILLLCRNSFIWALCYTAIFAVSRTTLAYFSDSATSTGSVVTAMIPSPTQIPITKIVINEVSSAGFQSDEWIELYNVGNTPINVQNWKIRDNGSFDILSTASTIIPPQSFVIVVGSAFAQTLPSEILSIRLATAIGDGLGNTADQLQLEDAQGTTFDQFSYGTGTILPIFPQSPAAGKSIIRFPNGADTDAATDFAISSHPTFGTTNQL